MNDETQGETNGDLARDRDNHRDNETDSDTARETETDMDGNESTDSGYGSGTRTDTAVVTGRHPVNIGHLVMGLAFAGLVVVWALIEGEVIADRDIRWLLPIPWVLAGTAGLLAVTLGNRRRPNH